MLSLSVELLAFMRARHENLMPYKSKRGWSMATVPPVGETLGRYRLVEQIGQGGMGVVFAPWTNSSSATSPSNSSRESPMKLDVKDSGTKR